MDSEAHAPKPMMTISTPLDHTAARSENFFRAFRRPSGCLVCPTAVNISVPADSSRLHMYTCNSGNQRKVLIAM
eukprot:COSAG02_NODE_90_length_37755_cov_29.833364_28_plen_74_part_00